MNKHRRVVSNSFILFVGQIVTWTSTLLLTMSYGRFLGDFKFGELYFALTFVLLMGIPIQFGYESQIIRSVSKEPDSALAYFSSVVLIKLSIWPIVYSSALLVSWLLGYSGEVRMLVGICGFTLLSSSIASTFASLHYAFERAIFPAVGNILEKGLSALVGILLLSTGAGVQVMALVLLGGSLINGIWQAIWFFLRVGRGFVIDWTLIRTIARTNIPFLLYGVVMVGYDRIDTMLLSVMATSAVVGWYGAAYRLFDTLSFLPNIVRNVLYPISSSSSDADLKGAVEKSINFLLLCAMPIAVGMIVVAPNIVAFLYRRPEFSHTVPALQFLAPGVVFFYVNMALSILLVTKRQDKKIPIIAAIALVFTLVLDLLLIPLYQHIGAAIVTSLTEVLLFCLNITFIPRGLWPLGSLRVAVKALLASLVMALAILPLHTFNIFVILPVAALVYFGAAALLGTLPREDYQAVYNALRRKVPLPSPVPLANQTNSGQEPMLEHGFRVKMGKPIHFLKTTLKGWIGASLPKFKTTSQEVIAQIPLAKKDLEKMP
jgi:O-antigen/teichoic acid export membrane protein